MKEMAKPAEALLLSAIALAPWFMVLLVLGPILAGLAGVLVPAFHGGAAESVAGWRGLIAWPGIGRSVWLSCWTGLATTALSLAVVLALHAGWFGTRFFAWLTRGLSPLLALPHVAMALGLAFLLSPSGWMARAVSPWLTGWQRPPDLLTIQDPHGIALILALVLKEVPFLFLMSLAVMNQLPVERSMELSGSLGYGRMTGWAKAVLPQLYIRLRLPVFAVLAYSMSVVDVAMVIGPTTPPPLAVQIVLWQADPDFAWQTVAAAGALLQLGLVGAAILLWLGGERVVAMTGRRWITGGMRGRGDGFWRWLVGIGGTVPVLLAGMALIAMVLWSIAGPWRFPSVLPLALDLSNWVRIVDGGWPLIRSTVVIALGATVPALILAIGVLESGVGGRIWAGVAYLPLLVPQIAFLPGVQGLMLRLGADGGYLVVTGMHLLFVVPYVLLSLEGPYRRWDGRYGQVASALGASPARMLLEVKWPMLMQPILVAAAIGISVSISLYLPTLLAGGGRIETLATEAVALSSGGDRRIIGGYAVLLSFLPWMAFQAVSFSGPSRWRVRHR